LYPDFIGIGAQKAGTTWLDRNLRVHPQVWMPRIKEIHYFDRKINDPRGAIRRFLGRHSLDQQWRRQVAYCVKSHLIRNFSFEDLLWDFKYYMRSPNDQWYASIFEPGKGRATGEITPAYSTLGKDKVAHVYEMMPRTKIIFMMRNPIERAWSQTVMSFDKEEKGSAKSVSEKRLLRRLERNSSALLTDYRKALKNWSSFYPEEQIFVGFLEDVHFYPNRLLRHLYVFLDTDPSFEPPTARKRIHSRSENKMPTSLATRLARTYYDELVQLSERFGGYASFWLYCAQRLIENPPAEETIPYPLWGSPLWREWTSSPEQAPMMSSREAEPQSGRLSDLL
jgi:hypothetical protein